MKLIITAIIAAIGLSTVSADVYVKPYFKKNGTHVQGHYRSNSDGNFNKNWSTKGNVNPYIGSLGTRVTKPRSYGSSFKLPTYRSTPTINTFKSNSTYTLPKVSYGYRSNPYQSTYSLPKLPTYRSSTFKSLYR